MTEPKKPPPQPAKSQIPASSRRRIDDEGILSVTLCRKGRVGDATFFRKKMVMGWGTAPDEIVKDQLEFARCTLIMSNGTNFYIEEPVEELAQQMFEGH